MPRHGSGETLVPSLSFDATLTITILATPKLRGRLTVLTSMSIAVGILMIYILGYIFPVRSMHNCFKMPFD